MPQKPLRSVLSRDSRAGQRIEERPIHHKGTKDTKTQRGRRPSLWSLCSLWVNFKSLLHWAIHWASRENLLSRERAPSRRWFEPGHEARRQGGRSAPRLVAKSRKLWYTLGKSELTSRWREPGERQQAGRAGCLRRPSQPRGCNRQRRREFFIPIGCNPLKSPNSEK